MEGKQSIIVVRDWDDLRKHMTINNINDYYSITYNGVSFTMHESRCVEIVVNLLQTLGMSIEYKEPPMIINDSFNFVIMLNILSEDGIHFNFKNREFFLEEDTSLIPIGELEEKFNFEIESFSFLD